VSQHWTSADITKDLARESRGGDSGRNNGDGFHRASFVFQSASCKQKARRK
jgi:hypothetical protein